MSKIIATVDLGSNSFHMLISKVKDDGSITTLSKQKQKIQLRAGLNENLTINDNVQEKAIKCLSSFAKQIKAYNVEHVYAVGTYTLRKARKNIKDFKRNLDKALGSKIRIISGAEEARLVYIGAKNNNDVSKKTLVVDIGGGSTEFVIGKSSKIFIARSLDVGCVGMQKDFFSDKKLNFVNFHAAIMKAKQIFKPIISKYKKISWSNTLGSSGTILSITNISKKLTGKSVITKGFLNDLITKMIDKREVDKVNFEGLREDRVNVLAGGTAILYAVFDCLEISQMSLSNTAVREGMLYEFIKNKINTQY